MPLAPLTQYRRLLVCPRCRSTLVDVTSGLRCLNSQECGSQVYSFVSGVRKIPGLVDFDHSVIERSQLQQESGETSVVKRSHSRLATKVRQLIKVKNVVSTAQVSHLLRLLHEKSAHPVILVVGGASIGSGLEELYTEPFVDILAFDIYPTLSVQFVADAHSIPLENGSVDAVIIQAVLEHVLEPWLVVAEVYRVLKADGFVYAETPFMQHVHEAAWDFTRFTESGHRYLFRDFERIASGWVAGAATQLYWSLVNFARAVVPGSSGAVLSTIVFSWLPLLDKYMRQDINIDAASCVFFLGRKAGRRMTPSEAVRHYMGGQLP